MIAGSPMRLTSMTLSISCSSSCTNSGTAGRCGDRGMEPVVVTMSYQGR